MPVTYHAWWPSSNDPYYRYNTSENTARINYYPPHGDGYRYTPYGFCDGVLRGYTYNSWGSWILSRYAQESPLEITLGGNYDEDSGTGTLEISVYAADAITHNNLKVRIALTEDSLYYSAPNGTLWHNYTMRDMIPGAAGTAIQLSQGETVELDQAFTVSSSFELDMCRLVVWVQADDGSYEVLQAARVDVEDLIQTDIDDNTVEVPREFRLAQNYPNPFNAGTTIAYILASQSEVELAIYDITGRMVTRLVNGVQDAGTHEIVWNGTDSQGNEVASGMYFYKLTTDGQSTVKRMALLK